MMLKMTNGDRYEAVKAFGNGRAIVCVDGALVMADLVAPDAWELSGEPARPGVELDTLNALVKSGTTVKVTDPDGATTTFEDP